MYLNYVRNVKQHNYLVTAFHLIISEQCDSVD